MSQKYTKGCIIQCETKAKSCKSSVTFDNIDNIEYHTVSLGVMNHLEHKIRNKTHP